MHAKAAVRSALRYVRGMNRELIVVSVLIGGGGCDEPAFSEERVAGLEQKIKDLEAGRVDHEKAIEQAYKNVEIIKNFAFKETSGIKAFLVMTAGAKLASDDALGIGGAWYCNPVACQRSEEHCEINRDKFAKEAPHINGLDKPCHQRRVAYCIMEGGFCRPTLALCEELADVTKVHKTKCIGVE